MPHAQTRETLSSIAGEFRCRPLILWVGIMLQNLPFVPTQLMPTNLWPKIKKYGFIY